MRILHILSQHQVTGAETYATTLADKHIAMGHKVWIVSDTLSTPTQATYIPQPIGKRTWLQRLINLITVRRLIKKHKIDIVHAHSRAATWIGYFATRLSKTGFVSSVHGRQSLRISKRILDIYGKRVIAVCENIQSHLVSQLKMDPNKISVTPNPIDFQVGPGPQADKKILSIVGRTSGPKGRRTAELINEVFPFLLESVPELEIRIIGGELKQLPAEAQVKLYQLQKAYPKQIQVIGFVSNLPQWLCESSCNIAAGRVAVESLLCKRPTIALGEADYEGLVTEENLNSCIASNFGDIHSAVKHNVLNYERIRQNIVEALLNPPQSFHFAEKIRNFYDSQIIAEKVLKIYRSLRMQMQHKKHIPVLMYHKVLNEERTSKHRIYVHVKRFYAHMRSLKKRNFTTLTFKDYLAFRNEKRPLCEFPKKPVIITFDDGYVNNLDLAFPILQEFQFKAVIFALGDMAVRNNAWDMAKGEPEDPLMDEKQLKTLSDAGIEIGAHSLSHRDLTKLSADEAYHEILESKLNLEQLLKTEVVSFAYPYGYYSEPVKNLVKKAGFQIAVATDRGGMHIEEDLFEIFRVAIFPSDHPWKFWKKTQSWYRHYYKKKRSQ